MMPIARKPEDLDEAEQFLEEHQRGDKYLKTAEDAMQQHGVDFIEIANTMADVANEAQEKLEKGEPVDVFEMFQKATDAIKYPKEDVLNDDTLDEIN